jgi:hypothetical protein
MSEKLNLSKELDEKIKEYVKESVGEMKNMILLELINHLLDEKRKYEMEDEDFNKIDEKEVKINPFIKELTKNK